RFRASSRKTPANPLAPAWPWAQRQRSPRSRPPAHRTPPAPAPRLTPSASCEMLIEKRDRAAVGEPGRFSVVVLAAFAGEGVILLGVFVHGDERIALQRLADGV